MDPRTKRHTPKEKDADTQSAELIAQAKKTELGDYIVEHKNLLIILGIIISIGLLSMPAIQKMSAEKNEETANLIYEFKNKKLDEYQTSKITADDFDASLKTLEAKLKNNELSLDFYLDLARELIKKKDDQQAISLLSRHLEKTQQKPFVRYFYLQSLAAAQENLGNVDEAIKSYEQLNDLGVAITPEWIKVELGRLYKTKGNLEKAKTILSEVATSDKEGDQFVKLAKILLQELN